MSLLSKFKFSKLSVTEKLLVKKGATLEAESGSDVNLRGEAFITTMKTSDVKVGTEGSEASLTVPVVTTYIDVTPTEGAVFVDRAYAVNSIYIRPQASGTTASTIQFYRVPAGTSGIASGYPINVTAFSCSGNTANIVKSLNMTASTTALNLATGDGIGYVFSAAPEGARGSITFNLKPI